MKLKFLKIALLVCVALLSDFFSAPALAGPVELKVGAYDFPPYFTKEKTSNKDDGSLIELALEILNKKQNQYHLKLVYITSEDRHDFFRENKYDVIFFEDLLWGWKDFDPLFVSMPVKDGEVVVSKTPITSPEESILNAKKIAGVNGYHYLTKGKMEKFKKGTGRIAVYSPSSVLLLVQQDRVDLGFTPKSYIENELRKDTSAALNLKYSQKIHTPYRLGVIAKKSGLLNKKDLHKLVDLLLQDAVFIYRLKSLGLYSQ